MKRLFVILTILSSVILFQNCKPYKPEGQGITGTITWLEGNQMPMVTESGNPASKPDPKPIKRFVRFYPLIKFSDLKIENGLYTAVADKPITEVETDENGRYSVQLSPGRYSVFVVEEGGLFANIFDGEGNVQPVTVKENEWTLLDIVVNYKAVY
ncbi:hypothetical protein B0E43_14520 [Algoriphagus sp. A40]|nr:hypothetical protein B0E43_14520 [Algoriphagus sp. A40]